jgi:hypothetical protein
MLQEPNVEAIATQIQAALDEAACPALGAPLSPALLGD